MMDENALAIVLFLVGIVVFAGLLIIVGRNSKANGRKKMAAAGYESLGAGYYDCFCVKDGEMFFCPNYNPRNAKPIEIIGINEITQNARLIQLEVRFRMDNAVTMRRIRGSTNMLLTLADNLGFDR